MKGLKRMFHTDSSRKPYFDTIPSLDPSLLKSLPLSQLCNIIRKYDSELESLQTKLEESKQHGSEQMKLVSKIQSELAHLKKELQVQKDKHRTLMKQYQVVYDKWKHAEDSLKEKEFILAYQKQSSSDHECNFYYQECAFDNGSLNRQIELIEIQNERLISENLKYNDKIDELENSLENKKHKIKKLKEAVNDRDQQITSHDKQMDLICFDNSLKLVKQKEHIDQLYKSQFTQLNEEINSLKFENSKILQKLDKLNVFENAFYHIKCELTKVYKKFVEQIDSPSFALSDIDISINSLIRYIQERQNKAERRLARIKSAAAILIT